MSDNNAVYGFRWATGYNGRPLPQPIEMPVASGTNFNVSGDATNLNLSAGDVVKILANGTVTLAGGTENAQTPDIVYGVVVGFNAYYNGTRMVRGTNLPSGITYGTNLGRQTTVLVVKASQGYWEVDCDDNVSATTKAAYQAFVGENVNPKNVVNAAQFMANPKLNIATHAVTAGLAWRIEGISQNFSNQDFSGANVKLIVSVNKGAEAFYTATGI